MIITVKVDALPELAQGVKEDLAMYLERFGDTRVLEVRYETPWQQSLFGNVKGGEDLVSRRNRARVGHGGAARGQNCR